LLRALEMTKLIPDRESARLSRCGRTDKGVHASGQVVALQLRSRLSSGLGVLSRGQWDWKARWAAHEAAREEFLRANPGPGGSEAWDRLHGFAKPWHIDPPEQMCPRCGVPGP